MSSEGEPMQTPIPIQPLPVSQLKYTIESPILQPEMILTPTIEGLKEFESKLAQILPIDDYVFKCMLVMHGVFTEDELEAIQSQVTPSDNAAELHLCLDHMISSKNFCVRIERLYSAMEDFEGADYEMKELVTEMRKKMGPESWSSPTLPSTVDSCRGHDYVGEKARENVKKAVCLIKILKKNSEEINLATAFLALVKLREEPSVVLLTNYHALGSDEIAKNTSIKFGAIEIPIDQLFVKKSHLSSNTKELDFTKIEIDWNKLKAINQDVEYIDLTKPVPVQNYDQVTVINHYSDSGDLQYSTSSCKVVGCLLLYEGAKYSKIFGGLVLKAVDGNFVAVGLHRGKFNKEYRCGTRIRDIILQCKSGKKYKAAKKPKTKTDVAALGPVRKDVGCSSVKESVRQLVKRAVCLIKLLDHKEGKVIAYGTGFFGSMQLSDKSSVVLVTNYHVIGNEEVAENSLLEFEGANVHIQLKELLVKATFICSDMNTLDFAMIEIDWKKLKEKHPAAEYIDLSKPAPIKDYDNITIIQHPAGGELSFSSSTCITYKYLLLYTSETACGSSGGPILKATKNGLEIVGLHRGGCEDHYNYGSKFSEILLSISEKKEYDKQSPKGQAVKDHYRKYTPQK